MLREVIRSAFRLLVSIPLLATTGWTAEDGVQGEQLFAQHCAHCHEPAVAKAPSLATLKTMRLDFLQSTLTTGKMAAQGLAMSARELVILGEWLVKDQPPVANWAEAASCDNPAVNLASGPQLGDWGYGKKNHRRQSAEDGGITSANVAQLQLKWVLAFPQVSMMRSQPALVGDTLFLAVADSSRVYALDADSGCVKWEFKTLTPARTAVAHAQVQGRDILWLGDAGGNVYVLDATTGKELWHRDVRLFKQNMITGQPVLHDGILYIPLSLYEIFSAMLPSYECCTGHGGIVAVDVLTGEPVWTMETMAKASKTHLSSVGVQQWGPSGAPVWNSPAIDEKRGLLYFGTGENTSSPATDSSDAIFALDLKTGEHKWSFQATANDTFNASCAGFYGGKSGPNCPSVEGPDHDFGASVMIVTLDNGRDVVLAGQKSGTVWALDPDRDGKLLWQTSLSSGFPKNGGIHWGMAYDGKQVFVPISDASPVPGFIPKPALHALDPTTGEVLWTQKITPSCEFDREQAARDQAAGKPLDCHPYYGLSAPATVAGDVVFVGGLDGMYRAFDAGSGEVLWQDNTNIVVDGINGVSGHGGAIDSNGSIISNGRVYIQSGYSMHGQMPGNLLLQYALSDTSISQPTGPVRVVAYSEESVAEGRRLFLLHCTACHGRDGKARIDFVSDATDLTQPVRWRNGTSEADIFDSLSEGAGYDMPPFKYQLTDDKDRWHLVNWIISTWPADERARLLGEQQ